MKDEIIVNGRPLLAWFDSKRVTIDQVSIETGVPVDDVREYVNTKRQQFEIVPVFETDRESGQEIQYFTSSIHWAWPRYALLSLRDHQDWEYEKTSKMMDLIKAYFETGFNLDGVEVPASIAETWDNEIKPFIDGRVGI